MALETPIEKLVSIESDPGWIQNLRNDPSISEAEASGRLSLLWSDIGPVQSWGYPSNPLYSFKWPEYSSNYWKRFGPFETALIDGRFRVACAAQAAINGCQTVIIHDFWNRPEYHEILNVLDPAERADTLAVLKPKSQLDRALASKIYEDYKFKQA